VTDPSLDPIAPDLPLTLWIDLPEHGCLTARIAAEGRALSMMASYLSNAPADLLEGVIALVSGFERATVSWQEEPGEYRWRLTRSGDRVQVAILWFGRNFSRRLDAAGETLFEAECGLRRLATQVKGPMHRLLNALGPEEYARRWRHPFPMAAFERLSAWIAERKGR
jgi:hypothetical protein